MDDETFLTSMVKQLDAEILNTVKKPYTLAENQTELNIMSKDKETDIKLKLKDKLLCEKKLKKFSDIIIEEKEGESKEYVIVDTRIGDQSVAAQNFITCINNRCDYIIKVIDIISRAPQWIGTNRKGPVFYNYNKAVNEIKLQIEASRLKLAPNIIDAFYCLDYLKDASKKYIKTTSEVESLLCKDKGKIHCFIPIRRIYIIMEKMDITVSTFLKIIKSKNESLFNIYVEKLKRLAIDKIQKLNSRGIIHEDAHDSNFMFNFSDTGKDMFVKLQSEQINIEIIEKQDRMQNFFNSFKSLKIIDFGLSEQVEKKDVTNDDIKKIEETFGEN